MTGVKARFQTMTRGFHAPDLINTGKVKSDYQSGKQKSHGERTGSAMGSVMSGEQSTHYIPLAPEQWQEKIRELKNVYVMKYPKIWQSLMYLMKYQDREDICERGTNKLLWKQCKIFINDDLFAKMGDFWPPGPKEDSYKSHEKLAFIQSCLNEYDINQVDDYSIALGKIYRWVNMAIDLRKEDVKQRRETKAMLDLERKEAIQRESERMEKRKVAFEEAKLAFEEKVELEWAMRKEQNDENENSQEEEDAEKEEDEKPEFDDEEWYAIFDDENPP